MELNIQNLIFQLVPFYKRLPNRVTWLTTLFRPLSDLWDIFHKWRIDTRMMVNMNSQKMVLERYLQIKYGEEVGIRIDTYADGMIRVALDTESEELQPEIYSDYEPEESRKDILDIPKHDEIRTRFNGVDFIVYIPSEENEEDRKRRIQIAADIEKYRQALIKYRIQ